MNFVLLIILFSIIMLGIISVPTSDAVSNGQLTIKPSDKSIDQGKQITFSGKLTDRNGYAVARSSIILWENDGGKNTQIGSGTTSARGEYKITITAEYWDGIGNQVEIFAYAGAGSLKSPIMTINIDKPRNSYSLPSQSSNQIQLTNSISNISTPLFLFIQDGTQNGSHQLKATMRGQGNGHITSVKILLNDSYFSTISLDKWTGDLFLATGSFTVTAVFDGLTIGDDYYLPVSKTLNVKGSTENSIPKTYAISPTQTTKISDTQYKELSYKIKSKYYDALQELESGVKLSENSLSGISFENSDAKIKVDSAWKIRYMVWTYIDEGKDILWQAETYLKNHKYQKAWEKLHKFDTQLIKAKNHISALTVELSEGKELEDKYQEKNKTCVFGWCNVKDTTKGLDVKIKDLDLKIEKIKNKENEIKYLYQMGVQNQKFEERESQSTFEQDESIIEKEIEKIYAENEQNRLENEKRQSDIIANEKQQRLEEQRQREQSQFEEELRQQEQKRLQEQREYEAQLRQQQLEAEQQRQRLEAQKQRELAEQQRQAEEQRQRLEMKQLIEEEKSRITTQSQNYPLIKGWMTGELTFYIQPFPIPVSQNVNDSVEQLASWMDGATINGVKLKRSYNEYADFSFNFVKDYQGEVIGRQVNDYLIVGLGRTSCDDEWKPYDGTTIYRLMYHEMGHALGQNHNNNPDNIMYKSIKNPKFEYDVKKSITLIDRNVSGFSICRDGTYSFVTEKTGTTNGYKTYLIPRGVNVWDAINGKDGFYVDCSSYENEMRSTSDQCYAPAGSIFVLYNPSVFGKGSDIPIDVKIINISSSGKVNYSFDKGDRQFSDDYLGRIKLLFRS
jgi:hypothetical protein